MSLAATRAERRSLPFSGVRLPAQIAAATALAACTGPQSTLDTAGVDADRVADLFWAMFAGAAVIWLLVVGLAVYATRIRPQRHDERTGLILIIGGGVVFPVVVLTALLAYGIGMMPELRAADPGGLRVAVSGEQWWWRVQYRPPGAPPVESANEIRLPVGRRVVLELTSPDVIHSFWIPPLAGKVDMIPGRTNEIVVEPTRAGSFRGQCAEYCGTSHALMAFSVVIMESPAYDAWLAEQARQAAPPAEPAIAAGADAFQRAGCGACHAVRGTPAAGVIGPDLTHVGGRESLGAGILPNDAGAFVRWIAETDRVKPDVHMPAFGMLPAAELQAMAVYLESLR